jgi:hypothetical protein
MPRNPDYVSPITGNPFAFLTARAPKLTPILPSCRTEGAWTRDRANDAKTRARKFLDQRWHRLVVEGITHTNWKGVQTREQIWEASRRLHAARTGDEVQAVISFCSTGV